jgi:hypothetical protein
VLIVLTLLVSFLLLRHRELCNIGGIKTDGIRAQYLRHQQCGSG